MQITLQKDGAHALASTMGAELVSYCGSDGLEYVWPGDTASWSGHAPFLFPIVGALCNNTVTFGGIGYTMPKHGIVRKREWRLRKQTAESVTFVFCADEETKKQYPFSFRLEVTHTLLSHGFRTQYTVFNEGRNPMGFCLGGHAGFRCPLAPEEAFTDYSLSFEREETCHPLYTDANSILHADQRLEVLQNKRSLPLHYDLFDKDVLIFDQLLSRSVTLQNQHTGRGFVFSFSGFNNLGVWTPPKKQAPLLCLEPWKGLPAFADESGAFEDKPDTVWAEPDAMVSASYQMEILPKG